MNLEELKKDHPELVAQIEQTAGEAARTDAASKERTRLQEIESIEAAVGDPEMIAEAKYGEKACTAQELSFRAMQKHAKNGATFLDNLKADAVASGAANVSATPGSEENTPDKDEADIQAVVNAYNKTKGGTK